MLGDTGGDGGLGFQLSMYRLLDDFERSRQIREAANERTAADFYLDQYNHLVGRYNALLQYSNKMIAAGQALEQRVEQQDEAIRAKDARIIELEKAVKATDIAYRQSMARLHKRAIEAIDLHQEIARLQDRLRSQET